MKQPKNNYPIPRPFKPTKEETEAAVKRLVIESKPCHCLTIKGFTGYCATCGRYHGRHNPNFDV